jgi:transmembrane sensor
MNGKASGEIETRASHWLERRDRDDWCATDQAALDAWLEQDPAHELAYWRLDAAWGRTDRLAALRNVKPETNAPRARLPLAAKIAAALIVTAALGGTYIGFSPRASDRTFSTALGKRETVSFADGSQIELNTNTVLRTRMTTAQRTIWLEKGEAFFHVRHDAAHPFVVIAGDHRVTDLGTEFSVRRTSGELKIAVLEGRVRLGSDETPDQQRVLTSGQVAAATGNSIVVTRRPLQSLANEMSWRRGVLVFDETALGEAAAELNRYNREQLVISDPSIARLVIAGTLPTDDTEGFARLAQTVLGLHVEHRGSNILISR